jgi:hypothetical protein
MGVIGVSNIFTAESCCDAGVVLSVRFSSRTVWSLALDGVLYFAVKIHRLNRFHFFIFSLNV